ncbi:glycosyltransferase [Candidatus Uhrbacteria bacterium]|nr:glycosyltransferase [Candidatus Uhrbacteria bacterium]
MHEQSKAFLMAGGGTLGSVTPLLAIAGKLRERDANVSLAWIGTPDGPERLVVESQRIPFYKLSSPKLDRYRTWTWPLLPFRLAISFLHALRLLYVVKPHMVFSAGGYVSVPVAWAAWVMRIPVWLHQLDTLPLLASKAIAPVAKKISVTFEETAAAFSAKKTVVVGTMVRQALRKGDKSVALKRYGFDEAKPTVLVIGGGTGAARGSGPSRNSSRSASRRSSSRSMTRSRRRTRGCLKTRARRMCCGTSRRRSLLRPSRGSSKTRNSVRHTPSTSARSVP